MATDRAANRRGCARAAVLLVLALALPTTASANTAPVCQNLTGSSFKNDSIVLLPNCSDADGNPLSYRLATTPASGSAYMEFGRITYYAARVSGPQSFTYVANDGTTDSAPATVAVTVVNRKPSCVPRQARIRRDKPAGLGDLECSDPDGDSVRLSVASPAGHGTVGLITTDFWGEHSLPYDPDDGYMGSDRFAYQATDSDGAVSDPARFDLVVTDNNPPRCQAGTFPSRVRTATSPASVTIPIFCSDPDAQDQLVIDAVAGSGPANGTLSQSGWTYTPNIDFTGADSFVVRASDGELSATATQRILVANGPYCDTSDRPSVRSGTAIWMNLNCTGAWSYTILSGPQKGTLKASDYTNRSFFYTAAGDAEGVDSFTFKARDTNGAESPVFTQSVDTGPALSQPPDCAPYDPQLVAYAGRLSHFFMSCHDPEQDAVTIEPLADPQNGTLFEGQRALVYRPDAGYTGLEEVRYRARDAGAAGMSRFAVVEVRSPEVPDCDEDSASTGDVRPGGSFTVQLTCSNPQNDPQTYAVATAPAKGTLAPGTGSQANEFTYRARPDATGTDTFTLVARNREGDSVPVTWTVTMEPAVNSMPECFWNMWSPQRVVRGQTVRLQLDEVCSDPDGDPLTFSTITQPSLGSVTAGPAAALDFTPTATGSASILLRVTDDRGSSSQFNFEVQVVASSAPSCTPWARQTLRPGGARAIALECADPLGHPTAYRIVSPPQKGTVGPISGNYVRYDAGADASGADSFTFQALSAGGESPVYTQSIDIDPAANSAPACYVNSWMPQEVVEAQTRVAKLNHVCGDVDGDALTYTIVAQPQHGTATLGAGGGSVSYTSAAGWNSHDSFSYTVSDGRTTSPVYQYWLLVVPPEAPACTPRQPVSVRPGASLILRVDCSDPYDEPLTTALTLAPTLGTVATSESGYRTYTAGSTPGVDRVSFTATSVNGTSAPVTQLINIDPAANSAPQCVAGMDMTKLAAGSSANVLPLDDVCHDSDGDSLTFAKHGDPDHGTLTASGGQLLYTPTPGYTGPDTIAYSASDGHGGTSGVVELTVNVVPGGNPTCATPEPITLRPGESAEVSASCTDPLDGEITYVMDDPPDGGTLSPPGDTDETERTYTAGAVARSDSFTYHPRSGTRNGAPVTQMITIDPAVNEPPTCSSPFALPAQTAVPRSVNPPCTDPDGDTLTYVKVGNPAHGAVTGSGGSSLSYTSTAGYTGADSFTYKANDGQADSNVATVSFDVTAPPNRAPTCSPAAATTRLGRAVTVSLTCADLDGQPLTLEIGTPPASGQGTLGGIDQAAGTVTFTPAAGYTGAATFTFRADDGALESAPATATITVSPNVPPTGDFTITPAAPRAGDSVTFSSTVSDTDGSVAGRVWDLNGDGIFDEGSAASASRTFASAGAYTVRLKVLDDDGAQFVREREITVAAADPGPAGPSGPAPGGGSPGGGSPGGGSGSPQPQLDTAPPSASLKALAKQKLGTVLSKGIAFALVCDEACKVDLQLVLDARTAKKVGLAAKPKEVVVGSLKRSLPGGASKVIVKLTSKARRKLKKAKSVKLKLKLSVSDSRGNAATVPPKTLTLKR